MSSKWYHGKVYSIVSKVNQIISALGALKACIPISDSNTTKTSEATYGKYLDPLKFAVWYTFHST